MYWEEESRKDKERYRLELEKHSGEYKMPKRRAKKHPLAPKRPMSAFLKYSKDKRKEVKDANPDLNNTDISRLLGQMWNEATEQEKEPYVSEELTARAAYKCAIAKFRVSQRNQEMDAIRHATKIRSKESYSCSNISEGKTPHRSNTISSVVREVSPTEHHVMTSVFDDRNKHDSMPPLSGGDISARMYHHSRGEYGYSHHPSKAQYYHHEDYDRYHHRDHYINNNYKHSHPSKESHYHPHKHDMDYNYYHFVDGICYGPTEDKRGSSDRRPPSPLYEDITKTETYRNGYRYDIHHNGDRKYHEKYSPPDSETGHYDSYWNQNGKFLGCYCTV